MHVPNGFSTAKIIFPLENPLAGNVGRQSSGRGVCLLLTVSTLAARCGCIEIYGALFEVLVCLLRIMGRKFCR